jgi:hypothetical protein
MRRLVLCALALLTASCAAPALAANCSTYPYTLANGTTADANQVMANFNLILNCANSSLAHNGANSDITSLSGLVTPLSAGQGGTGQSTSIFSSVNSWSGANDFTTIPTVASTLVYAFATDAPQPLVDGVSIAWSVTSLPNASVTLAGNRTLANFTGSHAGQTITVAITQDATGSRTLAYGTAYDFGAFGTPTLSTAAGKVDLMACYVYDAATPKARCVLNKAS